MNSAASTAPEKVHEQQQAKPGLKDRARGVVATWTPPEIWAESRPSLRDIHTYATKGDWTSATGRARTAGVWYGRLVAIPVTAGAYYLAWLAERPSRAIATLVLLVCLWQIPFIRSIASVLLSPLVTT
ncbi:hypothetical protein [Allonocardiopsis opalescens]|uniref:Uncharacterized protein n=1 Tax=Allonocardiopsis opalescens TaxID=1144618 RepID=A0A2T0PSZ3_9ACTN|nr:hypothetical protein [Allonocardiopsis opalescens]PRX92015.1 hypothetical protein CLV72_11288 [Allonocardiopsis opalescens]